MSALEIVRATEADIPFIMATERLPGNEGLVGRWEREEHQRALADGSNAYFVGVADAAPVGFVIVQHWASAGGATLIRRIIVADRGKKIGRELLSQVIDTIFAETAASRVWLNVFRTMNVRKDAYGALGFASRISAEAGESSSLLMVFRSAWRSRLRE